VELVESKPERPTLEHAREVRENRVDDRHARDVGDSARP
jgi:hypothetical protein